MTRASFPSLKLDQCLQWGLIILVALMPFHAFLSVWLGHLFGHQALIQAWKEALLVLLALGTVALVWRRPELLKRLRAPWIMWAAAFAAVAAVVTLIAAPTPKAAAFGLKTDVEFIVAAIIAVVVSSAAFIKQLVQVVLVTAALVVAFGLLQIFVLPPSFLTYFGYGPDTILPYQGITAGTDSLRFPATLGGPNQLGTYLILPICLSLALAVTTRRWWLLAGTTAATVVLINTHSRGAWIGAALAAGVTLILSVPKAARRTAALTIAGAGVAALAAVSLFITNGSPLQYYLLHSSTETHDIRSSDTERLASLEQGSASIVANPLGHGLGTAGPATFHEGAGNIIENYYLQIGYEAGVLGLATFIGLMVALTIALVRGATFPAHATAAAIVGVSVVSLVLPAWTDSSTSLILWTMAGALASQPSPEPAHV